MMAKSQILQALDDLRADVQKHGERLKVLQDDVTAIKSETAKLPAIEQRLGHHGKLLTGVAATMATVLEEQHAQRSDIRALHTEVHASTEEVKAEILAARAEARADSMDIIATAMRHFKDHEQRIDALEDATGIPHPDKH